MKALKMIFGLAVLINGVNAVADQKAYKAQLVIPKTCSDATNFSEILGMIQIQNTTDLKGFVRDVRSANTYQNGGHLSPEQRQNVKDNLHGNLISLIENKCGSDSKLLHANGEKDLAALDKLLERLTDRVYRVKPKAKVEVVVALVAPEAKPEPQEKILAAVVQNAAPAATPTEDKAACKMEEASAQLGLSGDDLNKALITQYKETEIKARNPDFRSGKKFDEKLRYVIFNYLMMNFTGKIFNPEETDGVLARIAQCALDVVKDPKKSEGFNEIHSLHGSARYTNSSN